MPDKAATPKLADFEAAMTELEQLVQAMESGDLSLEQSLGKFERGVALVRQCQDSLKAAELRIEQLTDDGELKPLDAGADADQSAE